MCHHVTDTLFKEVHYSLGNLIGEGGLDRIGLPDTQRPFVWSNLIASQAVRAACQGAC